MPVQQHVLNWLYSVLTSEYHDVNRTYNDVALVLTRYPTLTPRTDVHTFPNGTSALLLHLTGTLPVNFRGTTYRFPVSIWVPHAYPREAPLIYVTPTEAMVVRPGQHVDPQGQVYHPYLAGWTDFWDKSSLHDFLSVLSDVFAKEPPVISRQQQPRPTTQSPAPRQAPPPLPPLPPEITSTTSLTPNRVPSNAGESHPPPPPPKPYQDTRSPPSTSSDSLPLSARIPSRYESAPPLPPPGQPGPSYQQRPQPPIPQYQGPPPVPAGPPHAAFPQPQPPPPAGSYAQYGAPPFAQVQGQWQQQGRPPAWDRAPAPPPQQPKPPQDLLDDSLSLDLPDRSSIVAPPIPPNPEKDALLRQLAQTLAHIRQQTRQQNESSMAGLQAQRTAMLSAMSAIHAEMGQLTQFSNAITSNTNILHDALHKADAVIEGSKRHVVPDIDELLVAPTVVSNQLYRVVAEERALGDAIFMLGRAVERGRISPAAFAKMMRSLGREWYLKKALARKIGEGMGLMV